MNVMQAIQLAARRYNLDPRAMAAIAHHESGIRWGAVGDNGSSFGPFQLHIGGAMPTGKGQGFADSLQGVMYVARRMAASGAAGKSGLAAISAMSRNFERPADPSAEIRDALNFYKHGGGAGAVSRGPSGGNGARLGGPIRQPAGGLDPRQQLIANNWSFALTGQIDPLAQTSVLQDGLSHGQLSQMGAVGVGSRALRADSPVIGRVLKAAHSQIGVPYLWGGTTPGKGLDCSGLVQYAYAKAGIKIPRTTYEQFKKGSAVKWGQFRPGDLIFSDFEGTGGPSHVVMYIGNGKVIAAPHTGARVQIEDVSVFKPYFKGARRILH